ncbi:MAG: hypothetical protein KAW02_03870 [candidate division Zixibacteria bacterium]|nr:hypothetical protein [candidate division Zixibacteria bacterium]
MRKNILLIVLVAAIFVFVGAMSNSAKAADDPVDLIKNAKTPVHLHSLAPGDELVHPLESWISTMWHSLYPPATYCHVWHVIDERDNGIPGLNPSDKLKIEHVPDGSWVWVHVEEVTKTLKLSRVEFPDDTMYVEYTGGYDSLMNPETDPDYHPVSTWWHEIVPEFCTFYHLTNWVDNGDGELSFCDQIDLTDTLDQVTSWHVEDVATDILVQSIPDPTVPTMTQWGVIILVVLILASAIFIMVRRRRATVPA